MSEPHFRTKRYQGSELIHKQLTTPRDLAPSSSAARRSRASAGSATDVRRKFRSPQSDRGLESPRAAIHQSGAHNVAFISGLRRAPRLSPPDNRRHFRVGCSARPNSGRPAPLQLGALWETHRRVYALRAREDTEPRSVGQLRARKERYTRRKKQHFPRGSVIREARTARPQQACRRVVDATKTVWIRRDTSSAALLERECDLHSTRSACCANQPRSASPYARDFAGKLLRT